MTGEKKNDTNIYKNKNEINKTVRQFCREQTLADNEIKVYKIK